MVCSPVHERVYQQLIAGKIRLPVIRTSHHIYCDMDSFTITHNGLFTPQVHHFLRISDNHGFPSFIVSVVG